MKRKHWKCLLTFASGTVLLGLILWTTSAYFPALTSSEYMFRKREWLRSLFDRAIGGASSSGAVESGNSTFDLAPLHPRLLLYARVPKCASWTIVNILEKLSHINGFRHISPSGYSESWLSVARRQQLEKDLYNESRATPLSYERHFYFFETTRFTTKEVAWMSIVREPVQRFISFFYFLKANRAFAPDQWTKEYMALELNECTPAGLSECQPKPGDIMELQLTFFCGHDPRCRVVGDRWALQEAKQNAEIFSVIGIAEDVNTSLEVLEYYFPTFFTNYVDVKLGTGDFNLNQRPSLYSPTINNATRGILKNCLKEDVEFYDFVRQRFRKQADAVLREKIKR